jgi:hypothetical protein
MQIATCKRVMLIVASLGVLAVGGVFVLAWLPTPGDRITREAFEQIREGMTLEEVDAVIGVPPGRYAATDVLYDDLLRSTIILVGDPNTPIWEGSYGKVVVFLDAERRVGSKFFFEVIGRETFIDRLRRKLGL